MIATFATDQRELALGLAWRAVKLDRAETIAPAQLSGPDPAVPCVVWYDVAVILDGSDATLPYVEEVFATIADRPLPLPDGERVAIRVDLLACAGMKPLVPRFGYGIRIWDAAQQMTVADAIAACAQTKPPPSHLQLVTDRAPTGDWQRELARWRRAVKRHGLMPETSHAIWGEHLAEFDGFASLRDDNRLHRLTSRVDVARLLATLWQRTPQPAYSTTRATFRRPVRVLKPFSG